VAEFPEELAPSLSRGTATGNKVCEQVAKTLGFM